ncbi:MAG: sensor histidine kinase [Treponema sp.]|nr:sensor histidine kinase [Treponema sp.]
MTDAAGPEGARAFEFLYGDLVERIMSLADDPPRCVDFMATELRNIVGAKTVIVFECPHLTGAQRHVAVAVHPERRRDLGSDPLIERLAGLAEEASRATIVAPGDGSAAGAILAEAGIGVTLLLPLRFGAMHSGVIILLDLIDPTNESSIMSTLDRLSSALALILRNAWLYANLEGEVAARTAELRVKTGLLEASLREKEAMLKEIHHRVKNNLQIVMSLLYLKSGAARDEATRALFEDIQSRVAAISLVHEELYRADDFSLIDMREYLANLVTRSVAAAATNIELVLDLDPVALSPEETLPCGLIVNELVMNAIRHAFAGRTAGRLELSMRDLGSRLAIEIADDGPGIGGLPLDERPGAVGLSIVANLAAQLHGSVDSLEGPGTRIRLVVRKVPTG